MDRILSRRLTGCQFFYPLLRHIEGGTSVAAATVFERQIASETALSVVTGQTSCSTSCDEMFGGRGRAYLPRLWSVRGQSVTVSAGESFTWPMVTVAEGVAIRTRVDGRRTIRFLVVANTTRRDLAPR
jgi:hypothetical protein